MKTLCALLLTVVALGCSGYHAPSSTTSMSGVGAAQITSIAPTGVSAGGPQFTLNVEGNGFASNSVVYFNNTAQATQFVSGNQLEAIIPASQIVLAGAKPVYVLTMGGIYTASNQASNMVNFMVN
ncbi:MAG TPA: IPT/TIG domain-containing protein [Terriglobales bacterium]|nr:IPT/TIG domain-containing protein [Terriglobales bacterium]